MRRNPRTSAFGGPTEGRRGGAGCQRLSGLMRLRRYRNSDIVLGSLSNRLPEKAKTRSKGDRRSRIRTMHTTAPSNAAIMHRDLYRVSLRLLTTNRYPPNTTMKKTLHYTGHRWTTEELKELMRLWAADASLDEISKALNVAPRSITKQVCRMRAAGIPLERRRKGHVAGRANKPWSQAEVEFLMRRREEGATSDVVAAALGRTHCSVDAMIAKLRQEGVPVAMRGNGVRRLWNAETLKAIATQTPDSTAVYVDFVSSAKKAQ